MQNAAVAGAATTTAHTLTAGNCFGHSGDVDKGSVAKKFLTMTRASCHTPPPARRGHQQQFHHVHQQQQQHPHQQHVLSRAKSCIFHFKPLTTTNVAIVTSSAAAASGAATSTSTCKTHSHLPPKFVTVTMPMAEYRK